MNLEKKTIRSWLADLTPMQLIGVITFLGTLLGVGYYIGSEKAILESELKISKIETELDHYKHEWASIAPQIALTKKFNLKEHIISRHENNLPKGSKSFDNEFISLSNFPNLRYEKITLAKYHQSVLNTDVSYCMKGFYKISPLHVWRSDDVYHLDVEDGITKIYPHMFIQKISKPRLEVKLTELFDCWYSDDVYEQCGIDYDEDEANWLKDSLTKVAHQLDDVDIIGVYWSYWQYSNIFTTIFDPDISWDATQIQKDSVSLYATNTYTYNNYFDENTKVRKKLFVKHQTIMVELNKHIYYINIISPSTDIIGDSEFDAESNKWLTALRFLDE